MDYKNISGWTDQAQMSFSSKTGQVPQSQVNTQLSEGMGNILKSLQPGQVFNGEIMDIRGSYIQILLDGQQTVTAQLSEAFEFVIGQNLSFQVKENQGNQILIKPVLPQAQSGSENPMLSRALFAAGLQVTDKSLDLVKNLMGANQPIDRQTLVKYMGQMVKYPEADLKSLIQLNRNGIPVNGDNLVQLKNYQNYEHQLLKDVAVLAEDFPEQVKAVTGEQGPEGGAAFFSQVMDILVPDGEMLIPDTTAKESSVLQALDPARVQLPDEMPLTVPEKEELVKMIRKMGVKGEAQELLQRQDTSPEKALSLIKEAFVGKEPIVKSEHMIALFESPAMKKLVKHVLDKHLLINLRELPPEETVKEGVQKYYEGLSEKTEKLKAFLSSYGKENVPMGKTASNMSQNLNFIQSMNQMFTYIQLPLKMAGQNAHGDLYVYTRKKQLLKPGEEVSAMLHLDMDHLGAVDVLIRLKEQRIKADFTLESEELIDFIEEHMDLLKGRLEAKGYHYAWKMQKKEEEEKHKDLMASFFEQENPAVEIRRFSFDVRA